MNTSRLSSVLNPLAFVTASYAGEFLGRKYTKSKFNYGKAMNNRITKRRNKNRAARKARKITKLFAK